MVGGDVGRWGPCGLAHTRAMRGAHAGDAWRGGQGAGWSTRGCSPRGSRLCVARRLPCSRALSRSLREQGRAWTVEEGRQNTRGAWMAAAEKARGAEAKGPRRRRRSARLDGDDEGGARVSDGDEGGGEGGGARGGYRRRWAAVEKGGDREGGGGH